MSSAAAAQYRRQIADIGRIEEHLATVVDADVVILSLIEQHLANIRGRLVDRMRLDAAIRNPVVIDYPAVDHDQEQEQEQELEEAKLPEKTSKLIKKKEASEILPDVCSICCDHHPRVMCVTTSCGHHYGESCLDNWCHAQVGQGTTPTCPLCKTKVDKLITYRVRKTN